MGAGFEFTAEQRVQWPKDECLKPGADLYVAVAKEGHDQKQHGDDDDDDDHGVTIDSLIVSSFVPLSTRQADEISYDPTRYQGTMERLKTTSSLLLDETHSHESRTS